MKAASAALAFLLLGTGALHATCDAPDGSPVRLGEAKCINGLLMRCERLTSGTAEALKFQERCDGADACGRLLKDFNAKSADHGWRCRAGQQADISVAQACNAEIATMRQEKAGILRRCPNLQGLRD
jgi:hypothetical protein